MFKSEKYKRSIGFTEEMEKSFETVARYYSKEWLDAYGNNKIQQLWRRQDALSTQEIHTLGDSINTMLKIDEKWTVDQILKSKSDNANNAKGAIFEIVGLAMLNNPLHPVKTVKADNAGFDGILNFGEKKDLRVSIKNFGVTERQRDFEMFAEFTVNKIVALLKKYKYQPIQIIVDCPNEYPLRSDWFLLFHNLDEIFKKLINAKEKIFSIQTNRPNNLTHWIVMAGELHDESDRIFHPAYNSYTIIISGVYHKNEYRNVFSKIERACNNLTRHSFNEGNGFKNALLIHLPISLNIFQCHTWIVNYFKEHPLAPISQVLLYQPSLTRNSYNGTSAIGHAFQVFVKEGSMLDWLPELNITVVSGIITDAIKTHLLGHREDGTLEEFPIEGKYLYQKGKHYTKMMAVNDGGYTGNMQDIGSGVEVISVIEIPGQKGSFSVSGKFAPTDDLQIL